MPSIVTHFVKIKTFFKKVNMLHICDFISLIGEYINIIVEGKHTDMW